MSLWKKSQSMTFQMKANEQYFPVVLFIMLHKVVLTFQSVGQILPDIREVSILVLTQSDLFVNETLEAMA